MSNDPADGGAALHSGAPAFATLPDYFRSRFEPALAMLLDAAARSGEIRADVAPYDLLRAIGNLAVASGDGGAAHTERMGMLLLDGLRYGAKARLARRTEDQFTRSSLPNSS